VNIYSRWQIESMGIWEKEFIDLIEPGYILLDSNGTGSMVWGAINSTIHGGFCPEKNKYEFRWQGFDEGDPVTGIVRLHFISRNKAVGNLSIENGDATDLVLVR